MVVVVVNVFGRRIAARSSCMLAGAGGCTSSSSLCGFSLLLCHHASCIKASFRLSCCNQNWAINACSLSCQLWFI
jgi:hypothetical protein